MGSGMTARSNRSRAGTSDGREPLFLSIIIDKIRNMRYIFSLTESLSARHRPWPGGESPRLFEMFAATTPACEPGRRRIPYFLARNPLKSLDSEK
jgi:hypothetical protein